MATRLSAVHESHLFSLSHLPREALWPAGDDVRAGLAPENAFGGEPSGDRPQGVAGIARDSEEEAWDRRHGPNHSAAVDKGVDAGPGANDAQGTQPRDDVLGEAQIADHAGELVARDLARRAGLRRPATADDRLTAAKLLQGDRPLGMLDEMMDKPRRALGDVDMERIAHGGQIEADPRSQRLCAVTRGQHYLARLDRASRGHRAKTGALHLKAEYWLLP